jgi:hypothetical protein
MGRQILIGVASGLIVAFIIANLRAPQSDPRQQVRGYWV